MEGARTRAAADVTHITDRLFVFVYLNIRNKTLLYFATVSEYKFTNKDVIKEKRMVKISQLLQDERY